ncbi:AAA family ATPase [Citrobacter braakii]|nr:AAA family ATPase [Citrobacter braakii]
MKIKRIKLKDFRQFYGSNNIIEFSTDEEKNVTLIHAENGVGKTTLLNSILWCFYGKFTSDFEHPKNIVNIDSLANGVAHAEVEVEFIHEGGIYSAARRYDQRNFKSSLELFFIDNGNYQPIRSDKQLLNSVIPEEMAEYFLFHGEGISQLQSKETSFRNAIRDILGFNLAKQAIDDMEIIGKKWQGQLSKINAEKSKFTKIHSEIISIESDVKSKQMRRNQNEELIDGLKLKKKELDDEILNCKIVDATDIKKNISSYEIDKKRRYSNLKISESKRQKLISTYGWRVFGTELSEKSLDFIDTTTLTGKIPAPYDETLVNDIINSAKCICGRCVDIGSQEYTEILNLLDKANTYELKNNLMKARSFAQVIGKEASAFIENFNEINKDINELRHEIADLEGKIKDLNTQLDNIDDEKIRELRLSERNVTSEISKLESANAILSRDIDTKSIQLQQFHKEYEKYAPQGMESYKILESINFIKKISDQCHKKMSETESSSKLLIAQYVNDILETFSRKDFLVKVSDSFNFELTRGDGGIVAKSKGEKLLLNLAFVSALIKLAAQRINGQGKFLQPGTVAPFIIDAPFGELDETYRKATVNFLPENSEQLVLLLSSSHWRGTVGEDIKNKVGKEYILLSHKKNIRGNKPLDEIIIDGVKINQSIYNSSFEGTSIFEVK